MEDYRQSQEAVLVTSGGIVSDIAYWPGYRIMAVAGTDGRTRIFSTSSSSSTPRCILGRAKGIVTSVSYHPDASVFATGSFDGRVRVYRSVDALPLYSLKHTKAGIDDVQFNADGSRLVAVGKDGKARIYNPENPDIPLQTIEVSEKRLTTTAYSVHNQLAIAGDDGFVRLYSGNDSDTVSLNSDTARRKEGRSVSLPTLTTENG